MNRLRPFLNEIISPLQGSFILSRGTTSNIIVAQKVLNHLHKSKRQKVTIGFESLESLAYDSVNWDFLEATLVDFGFPNIFVKLIMNCVRSSVYSLGWLSALIVFSN